MLKSEALADCSVYAYDGLERLSERKGEASTQVYHYGDLTDLLTYLANGEGKTTTSYVQGPRGLAEQRTGEATSYPLADAHGDITAITGPTGGVESRQEYGPWGEQLSGPSLEMGFLGAWERPSDAATGLIQMGARSYDPAIGRFVAEDPVLGRMGLGISVNRYLYVWDNPLTYYDLNGRETCVSTPLGSICPVEEIEKIGNGAETAWHGAESVGRGIGHGAESAWNWTAPGRGWIANQAQDFWKEYGSTLESAYKFAGENWQTCLEGGSAGAAAGFYGGTVVFPVVGSGVGAAVGGGLGCAGLVGARIGISALAE